MVCRLSSVTSVPYKQFSWGKTIIIHYFHRDGQLTDIFTPQHPGDLMKHNEALSLLLVSFHRIFTLVDLLSESTHVLLKNNADRELLNSDKRINVRHGQARWEKGFCFFKYRNLSQVSIALTFPLPQTQSARNRCSFWRKGLQTWWDEAKKVTFVSSRNRC